MAVKVKICGITNLADAQAAVDMGADALGFNFYKKSPRFIAPKTAAEIISALPNGIEKIGVFVDPEMEQILSVVQMLDFVQLHGDEEPEFVASVSELAKVIKSLRVGTTFEPSSALLYPAVRFLLDSESAEFGGSGHTFSWTVANRFKELVPDFYLAGGLEPDNVADAIRVVHPYGVDVCSGVERTKGIKDHDKVEAFIRNAKEAI